MTRRLLFPLVAVLALLVGGASLAITTLQKKDAEDGQAAAQLELVQSAEKIRTACAKDPARVRALLGPDACTKAKEITERPPAEKGERGAAGPRGPKGDTGATGATGPVGPRGPAGPAGPAPGCLILVSKCEGPQGPRGFQGLTGQPGAAGQDGTDGADGAVGEQGPKGDQGPTGPAGPAGPTGPQGEVGPTGPTGPQGPAGPACPDGSTLQKVHEVTVDSPAGVWVVECVLQDQNPEGPPPPKEKP